jgi:capsular exopolysaccharide synthesis family protein
MSSNRISLETLARASRTPGLVIGPDLIPGLGAPETQNAVAQPLTQAMPFVRRLWRVVMRRRLLLGGGMMGGALLGLVISLALPRQYTSTARLAIARENDRVVKIDSVERDASFADQEFYQTQYGLLQTKELAERVARDLKLVDDRGFFATYGPPHLFDGNPSDPAARDKRNTVAGKILLEHVNIAPVRGSSLVDITAVTRDPGFSRQVAQVWAQDFIAANLDRRFEASSYARHFLEGKLEQLGRKLEMSERASVGYAAQQGIVDLPSGNTDGDKGEGGSPRSLVSDDLGTLNAALNDATNERIRAESLLSQSSHPDASGLALSNEALGVMRQKRAEAAGDYAKLLNRFEPDYPQAKALASQIAALDAAIAREEGRVRSALQMSYQSALSREQKLTARVASLKHDMIDLRQRSIQYNIYQRDAGTNRELYNGLLQRYKEIGIAGGIANNNITVADAAKQPENPSSPRLLVNLVLGLLTGAMLSAATAAVLEQIDEGLADPGEVPEKLGLPLLGVVPQVEEGAPAEVLSQPRSPLVEAYLAVQANLGLSTAQGMPKSLAVISTRPREGKSTTTLALARSLAQSGRKVVMIDADLRSPSIHHTFGMKNTRGVSNVLAGEDDLEALLHDSPYPGLSLMTAGPQPPNAAHLLAGGRLPVLIDALLTRFDHVLVDCPPVIGLADAPLVGSAVDGVVFVVEARSIQAGTVRIALDRLRAAHVNLLGAVLTKFEARRTRFAYSYDYGYGYGRDGEPSAT